MSKRIKESNERNEEGSTSSNLLSRLSTQDLKSIKVAIRRHNVPEPTSPVTVQRHLEDPAELIIHRREDEGQHPIFDRRDIIVNVEKNLEERFILKSPAHHPEEGREKRSHSKSFSDRERSVDSYRSRSRKRSKSLDRKASVKKTEQVGYEREPRLHPSRNVEKSHADVRRRSRSASPSYKRRDDYSKEKYYREKSPKPGTSKERREDAYKKDKYRLSPKKTDYRDVSPKREDKNRSRSRTPKKFNYKYEKDKYGRPRSPPPPLHSKRYSTSPHRKRSRSPHSRRHSPSPYARRRSRSPHSKRTPPRDSNNSKPRKRSTSPYDHSRATYPKRRSRSPYPRSRSPHKSESSHRYRRSSRSPRKDPEYYRRRSRSPRRRGNRPEPTVENYDETATDDAGGYGCDPNFPYYGPPALWIPGPMLRPRIIFPDGPLPPPRGMPPRLRPGYYIPRPYMPMPGPFEPRFPVYPRPYRLRLNSSTAVTTVTSTVTSTVTRPTPTTSTVSASVPETTNPIVEEPESNDVVSTVQDKA